MTRVTTSNLMKHATSNLLNCNKYSHDAVMLSGSSRGILASHGPISKKTNSSLFMVRPNMFENYKATVFHSSVQDGTKKTT